MRHFIVPVTPLWRLRGLANPLARLGTTYDSGRCQFLPEDPMIKPLAVVVATALSLAFWAPPAAAARPGGPDRDAAQKAVQAEIDAACPCDGAGAHPTTSGA
jgi:hypothetical protein